MKKKVFFWAAMLFMYILGVSLFFIVDMKLPIEAVDQALATKVELKRALICGIFPIIYPIYMYFRSY